MPPAMPVLDEYRDAYPLPPDAVAAALAQHAALLGPCAPLPALWEEVLRAWRGLPVRTARFLAAEELLDRVRRGEALPALRACLLGAATPPEARALAAALWAQARPDDPLPWPDAEADPAYQAALLLAQLPSPDPDGRYPARLAHLLTRPVRPDDPDALPEAPLLLAFLKGLADGTLPPHRFNAAVVGGRALHPGVSAHRPLQRLHRLLDYLGLSGDPGVAHAYRQLVAQVWPVATVDNWPSWQWVTQPGGPEAFPRAVQAAGRGACTLLRLYELRYAPLPPAGALNALLAEADPVVALLCCWLRPGLARRLERFPLLQQAVPWMLSSQTAAADAAYAAPAWWEEWLRQGMPLARRALTWLQHVPLPRSDTARPAWLERYLLPDYPAICANVLLAQAACGERLREVLSLADDGHLPAVRALALAPQPSEAVYTVLRRHLRAGGRPLQAAARQALEHLARRQGLPGADELERQHVLAAAWEQGPLAGERVRVGWEDGLYRLRLSLHGGAVRLDVLGPQGPLARVPAALRAGEAYRQARAAQRDTQAQYRLFRRHLETAMVEGTPFTLGEFRYLMSNPVFAHLAERLLWQTADGEIILWAGPERWDMQDGTPVSLPRGREGGLTLTLPHPVALAASGVLRAWQSLAADRRLVQPFKQLFREVYLCEDEPGTRCTRFAGRRLEPGRAYAVLRAAGCAPGNGTARRDWPYRLTAHLCWGQDVAGRDLFGPHRRAEVLSGDIRFTRAGAELPLREVDPVVFSETLRTADLLTTRAAVGEAALTSRETVALRALLLREVARSFRLTNIAVPEDGRYALVLGARATYRVNLVSGTVYLEPEGRQVVIPRHGAPWQPAEDGDATSEILALVLELAGEG